MHPTIQAVMGTTPPQRQLHRLTILLREETLEQGHQRREP